MCVYICTFTRVWESVHVCTCGGLTDKCLPRSLSTLCIEAESVNHEVNYLASLGSKVVPEIPAFDSLVLGLLAAPHLTGLPMGLENHILTLTVFQGWLCPFSCLLHHTYLFLTIATLDEVRRNLEVIWICIFMLNIIDLWYIALFLKGFVSLLPP